MKLREREDDDDDEQERRRARRRAADMARAAHTATAAERVRAGWTGAECGGESSELPSSSFDVYAAIEG
jgi:phage gp16-like protein